MTDLGKPNIKTSAIWIPWVLVALLLVLTLGAAVLAATNSGTNKADVSFAGCPSDARFTGYVLSTAVHQISAAWRVPTLSTGAVPGIAATWIGVQSRTGDFLQVGTDERNTGPRPRYSAFWEVESKHLIYHMIRTLSAGDLVRATISRQLYGWRITFSNITGDISIAVAAPYGRDVQFSSGEWLQEDVSTSCTVAPYPRTSVVTVGNLRLNDVHPHLRAAEVSVLEAPNRVVLVPTPVNNDRFSIVTPGGIRAQYLLDIAPFNDLWASFTHYAERAYRETRRASQMDLSSAFALSTDQSLISATDELRSKFEHQRWPDHVQRSIKDLTRMAADLLLPLRQLELASARPTLWTLSLIEAVSSHISKLADALRSAIGLPGVPPATVW